MSKVKSLKYLFKICIGQLSHCCRSTSFLVVCNGHRSDAARTVPVGGWNSSGQIHVGQWRTEPCRRRQRNLRLFRHKKRQIVRLQLLRQQKHHVVRGRCVVHRQLIIIDSCEIKKITPNYKWFFLNWIYSTWVFCSIYSKIHAYVY